MQRGIVVTHSPGEHYASRHERATRAEVARRLAALKGFDPAGELDPAQRHPSPVYVVPGDTLVGAGSAEALGIHGEDDLFGGVVPYPFVATKAITHPLLHPAAAAPEGWSHAFGPRVRDAVLAGYSVFTLDDALRAGALLLRRGPVRLKPVRATAGRGQEVMEDEAALGRALAGSDPAELSTHGLVLEENLTEVTTYSVGQARVAGMVATYHGTQRLTRDRDGAEVYGGSTLIVVRGGFAELAGLAASDEVRLAVAQARAYDAAATECFPGFFASRRNYDVARGRDAAGRWRSGVLEQSWRVGGATGAEVAALEAFRAHPSLRAVRASTVEIYGEGEPPAGATVYFHGVDEAVGPMTKYAVVEPYADPE